MRMLKSMGWTEGSGLGKNEDGKIDNLAVELRPDTRGMLIIIIAYFTD